MNHSSAMHVENKSDACTHIVHICVSESSSLGCRVANRMLSSVLPAGGHALSITAKYRHLLSEGLEELGCPNQSPDLNPCRAIKLKQFRVMEASKLFSCCVTGLLMLIWVVHEVMWLEPECCPFRRIGVCRWMVATTAATMWVDVEPGAVHIWLREQMEILICRCGFEIVKWRVREEWKLTIMSTKDIPLTWFDRVCVCVYVSMHAALQHRCPSPAFDCKRWASRHFYELGTSNTSLSSFYHFPEHSAHVTPC